MSEVGKPPLPAGWKWVRLSEAIGPKICTFDRRKFPKPTIRYIDISSVDNVSKRIVEARDMPASSAPSRATYFVRTGDILIATVRPNLNAVALVPAAFNRAVASNGFCVLRFKREYAPEFFFQFLISPAFVDAISELVAGAMYPAVNDEDILRFEVPAPSDREQQEAIAAEMFKKLNALALMRSAAAAQQSGVKAFASATYRDVFPCYETGVLPKGWEWRPYRECFATFAAGTAKIPESAYASAGRTPIVDQSQKLIAGYTDSKAARCEPAHPVIVFGDHTCCVKLVDFPFAVGADGTKLLRAREGFNAQFLAHVLRAAPLADHGYNRHFKLVQSLSFPIPATENEQRDVAERLDKTLSSLTVIRAAAARQSDAISALPSAFLREVFTFAA